jgi:hypothetical protein
MDPAPRLTEPSGDRRRALPSSCPACGTETAASHGVASAWLDGLALARCSVCGERWTVESFPRPVSPCETCGLPRLDASRGCPLGDHDAEGPAEPELVAASEGELQAALAASWRFASAAKAQGYLDRLARQIARQLELPVSGCRVLLVDERRARTLGLPSATVILSTGMLATVEDEAELVFVLGRELAHVAAGEAAARWVAIGLRAIAHGEPQGLARAALDAASLGYGDARELAADVRAAKTVALLGYDPAAVRRHLDRLAPRIASGDDDLGELALALPPPALRARRIEAAGSGRWCAAVAGSRLNREVFRRAVGPAVLAAELVAVEAGPGAERGRARRSAARRVVVVGGALALGVLLLLLALRSL